MSRTIRNPMGTRACVIAPGTTALVPSLQNILYSCSKASYTVAREHNVSHLNEAAPVQQGRPSLNRIMEVNSISSRLCLQADENTCARRSLPGERGINKRLRSLHLCIVATCPSGGAPPMTKLAHREVYTMNLSQQGSRWCARINRWEISAPRRSDPSRHA
jgi:hypothetical protein